MLFPSLLLALAPLQGAGLDGYAPLFERALAALDAGEHAAAAEGFRAAGELAPGAPVWRVHAGIALARGGDTAGAVELLREALELGYPTSDLEALDATLAARARAGATLPASTERWRAMQGRRDWTARTTVRARDHGTLLELQEVRTSDAGDWLEHVFLDPATLEVVVRLSPPRPGGLGWKIDPDGTRTPLPDPRPVWLTPDGELASQRRFRDLTRADAPQLPSLSRGLRTGLWLDSPQRVGWARCGTAPSSARLGLRQDPDANEFVSVDLARLEVTGVAVAPTRSRGQLEPVPPGRRESLFERVNRSLRPAPARAGALDWRAYSLPGEERTLAFARMAWGDGFGLVYLLDGAPDGPVLELATPIVDATGIAPFIDDPVLAPDGRTLLLACSTLPSLVVALDLERAAVRWTYEGDLRGHGGGPRELSVRAGRVVCHGGATEAELLDLETGALVWSGARAGLASIDVTDDGALVLGRGEDSAVLIDGVTFAPLASLWVHDGGLVVAAVDGTFSMPAHAVQEALVQIGPHRVPARTVAPWLLDPLHARTLCGDADRAPRRFPVR